MGRTLRRLDLSGNYNLQINQAGFDALLALTALEVLDLRPDPDENGSFRRAGK